MTGDCPLIKLPVLIKSNMKIIRSTDRKELQAYFKRLVSTDSRTAADVKKILAAVASDGDKALVSLTARFDGFKTSPKGLRVTASEFKQAKNKVDPAIISALLTAKRNISAFCRKQKTAGFSISTGKGASAGMMMVPIETAGIYVPGGKAVYPSTVLMNAIPAITAGVKNIVMCTPAGKDGKVNPVILAAASLCGIKAVYKLGGAQAIAAMAYGTKTVRRADKIVGPGNLYVATAKQMIFGQAGIDSIAGPSEVLLIADCSANPEYAAADLLAQAEHDEDATCIMLTDSSRLAAETLEALNRQKTCLPKSALIEVALKRGCIVITRNLKEAAALSNIFAPEHLQLMTRENGSLLKLVRNAGAVFIGNYSPVALGDYIAGTNHVLPTSGSARFSSGLSVSDFIKKIGYVKYSKQALKKVGLKIRRLAESEGLRAHAISVKRRD